LEPPAVPIPGNDVKGHLFDEGTQNITRIMKRLESREVGEEGWSGGKG